jgi:hypothetical protein
MDEPHFIDDFLDWSRREITCKDKHPLYPPAESDFIQSDAGNQTKKFNSRAALAWSDHFQSHQARFEAPLIAGCKPGPLQRMLARNQIKKRVSLRMRS